MLGSYCFVRDTISFSISNTERPEFSVFILVEFKFTLQSFLDFIFLALQKSVLFDFFAQLFFDWFTRDPESVELIRGFGEDWLTFSDNCLSVADCWFRGDDITLGVFFEIF